MHTPHTLFEGTFKTFLWDQFMMQDFTSRNQSLAMSGPFKLISNFFSGGRFV